MKTMAMLLTLFLMTTCLRSQTAHATKSEQHYKALEVYREKIKKLDVDQFFNAVGGPMKINLPENDYGIAREALIKAITKPVSEAELEKLQKNFGRLYYETYKRQQELLESLRVEILEYRTKKSN